MGPPAPGGTAASTAERTWHARPRVVAPILMALGVGISLLPLYDAATGVPAIDPWWEIVAVGIFTFEMGLVYRRLKLHVTPEAITVVNFLWRWEISVDRGRRGRVRPATSRIARLSLPPSPRSRTWRLISPTIVGVRSSRRRGTRAHSDVTGVTPYGYRFAAPPPIKPVAPARGHPVAVNA